MFGLQVLRALPASQRHAGSHIGSSGLTPARRIGAAGGARPGRLCGERCCTVKASGSESGFPAEPEPQQEQQQVLQPAEAQKLQEHSHPGDAAAAAEAAAHVEPAELGAPPQPPALRSQDLKVVVAWLQSVGEQEAAAAASAGGLAEEGSISEHGADPGSSSSGTKSRAEAGGAAAVGQEVPVEWLDADPFPDQEPELPSQAEPLTSPASEISKKARKLRKRGQEVLSTAQQAAADAADLAATVASEAQEAAAAAQEEAVLSTAELAAGMASDAADVMGAVQAAAEDVQQQAGEALAGSPAAGGSSGSPSPISPLDPATQIAAPVPPAGELSAPAAAAGELPAPTPAAGELPAPTPAAGELPAARGPAGSLSAPASPAGALESAPEPVGAAPPPPDAAPPSNSSEGSSRDAKEAEAGKRAAKLAHVKLTLVEMLASLDRGAAATQDQVDRVDALARQLEALGGPVNLSAEAVGGGSKSGVALLDGRWRLLYSSGFSSGSLGGRRPGPSFGSGPFTLGQVFQDINTDRGELDNVVDLFLRASLAALPLPGLNATVPSATARLRHTFRVLGAATVEITFTDTEVQLAGGLQGWLDSVPRFTLPALQLPDWLQPSKSLRSAQFDVVFIDEEMRITRGDRGELRVFLKGMV